MREPFFGPNAKPFIIQAAVAIGIGLAIPYTLGPWIIYPFSAYTAHHLTRFLDRTIQICSWLTC